MLGHATSRRVTTPLRSHLSNTTHLQSGQVAIIVLLMMVALVTVGISVGLRTTQVVRQSGQNENTTRVFNAAESGIDQALSAIGAGSPTSGGLTSNGVDVNYTVSELASFDMQIAEGTTPSINLTGSSVGNQVRISWSKESNCTQGPAALVISVYYTVAGSTLVQYLPYTPCNRSDGFYQSATTADAGLSATAVTNTGNTNFAFSTTVTLPANSLFLRIKPVYSDTNLEVAAIGWTMPTQTYSITSKANNQTGQENRVVQVKRSLATASSIFDFALVSGTTVVK